jgi:hypothetical protein
MPELRRDFGERSENELPLQHSGMRDLQFGSVERLIAEEKNVYIEDARALGESFLAAELRFDGAEGVEKFDGLGINYAFDYAVEEPGLAQIIDRLGFVEGRNLAHMKICGRQRGDGGS